MAAPRTFVVALDGKRVLLTRIHARLTRIFDFYNSLPECNVAVFMAVSLPSAYMPPATPKCLNALVIGAELKASHLAIYIGSQARVILMRFLHSIPEETAEPTPQMLISRTADALRGRANADVTAMDVPAVGAVGAAAAGERGMAH